MREINDSITPACTRYLWLFKATGSTHIKPINPIKPYKNPPAVK